MLIKRKKQDRQTSSDDDDVLEKVEAKGFFLHAFYLSFLSATTPLVSRHTASRP